MEGERHEELIMRKIAAFILAATLTSLPMAASSRGSWGDGGAWHGGGAWHAGGWHGSGGGWHGRNHGDWRGHAWGGYGSPFISYVFKSRPPYGYGYPPYGYAAYPVYAVPYGYQAYGYPPYGYGYGAGYPLADY